MFEYLYLLYEFGLCKIYYITSHNEDKPCPLKKYNNHPSTFLYSISKSYRKGKYYHDRIFHIYKINDKIPVYYIEKFTNYSDIFNSDYVNQVQYYDTFEELVREMHVILNSL